MVRSKIVSVDTFDGPLEKAFPPMSVTLTLADDVDISRGDMITGDNDLPNIGGEFQAMICWMTPIPLKPGGRYALKHTTRDVKCILRSVDHVLNINTLEKMPEGTPVKMNDIASVLIRTTQPLFYDPYVKNRITGSIILIDEATHETVGAGMVL